MKKLFLALGALVLAGIAGFFAFSGSQPKETPQLRLEAVLSATGEDISTRVPWRVKWNGSGLGPQVPILSQAMPGEFLAELEVLGGADATGKLVLAEGQGGTLRVDVDATLVEVTLPDGDAPARVGFQFETPTGVGSASGVLSGGVSGDKIARALVSREVTKLELETPDGAFRINGGLSSGGEVGFVFDGSDLRQTN